MKAVHILRPFAVPVRGFTLLELITAMAVLAILVGIGVPAFNNMIRGTQIAAESGNLSTALTLARSEAVKRGIRVSLCPKGNAMGTDCDKDADWNKGWIMFADDFGKAGEYDPSDFTLQVWEPPADGVDITTTDEDTVAVTFDRTGRAEFDETFQITKAGCKGDQSRLINVGLAGRVSLTRTECP